MTQGANLYRLQHLDTEGDSKQSRLAEVQAALKDDKALKRVHQALASAQGLVQKWSVQQRDQELEIQGVSDKTSRSEQRLYSGAVKNPKELADLQAEVASLKRRRQKLEDDLLETMIELEETEATQTQARQHLDETQAHWENQQADLIAEQTTLQDELSEIEQERTKVLPRIEADNLDIYQHLRRRKGGLAVAQMNGIACGICGMAVSPNRKWQIREEGLGRCSNCERIIVYIK